MLRQSAVAARAAPSAVASREGELRAAPVRQTLDARGVGGATAVVESPPHAVDVADGMEHGWIYVDNVESGSTTVLQRTMAKGTWCHGAVVDGVGCRSTSTPR